MPIAATIHHRTTYQYDRPVTLSPQVVRLRPAPHTRTPIRGYRMRVTPDKHFCNWQQDPQGNWQARLVFPDPVDRFEVDIEVVADLTVVNPFDFFVEPSAEHWPFAYEAALAKELRPFLEVLPLGPLLAKLLAGIPRERTHSVNFLVDLNQRLQRMVRYIIRMEPGVQTPEETLEKASGSCRDSAWLMVQLLRHLGIAARFCSGYLVQLVADVKPLDGPAGTDKDFTDLHAWCEAYIPGAGWVGFDPTSGLLAGEGHIPLAATPDPSSAAPITGSFAFAPRDEDDEVSCEFGFHMEVVRIHEDPRVTKPYTPEQVAAIDAAGRFVDGRLKSGGCTLTQGGEPTFVATDDPDGPEWNTEANGLGKRRRARQLAGRLREAFAPGGFLFQGQGKWYPGEQLPRWAFGLHWRPDGVPLWKEPALIADEARPSGHGADDAKAFIHALAERLGVAGDQIMPGYEDAWYHLWRERRLPANVDPLDNRIDDPLERERLARVFRQGLGAVVGYALPLACQWGRWTTGKWFLREERLYLIPGDSPMGFRLPLDSLPWAAPGDRIVELPTDPTAPRPDLRAAKRITAQAQHAPRVPAGTSAPGVVRTTLCVEPRGGMMHVFIPPVMAGEDYWDLVAAIEGVAADLAIPVACEGYAPPHDDRVRSLSVTPDPGVIEVNVHPAHDWEELTATTRRLYDEAFQCRLGSEKFLIDGRHVGTGGGNHITLGGPTPLASPFLRRPDLLASLVSYWNNHPALSYLFSGLFIGPTSQAPRPDEGRADMPHELGIALRQLAPDGQTPPWLVDRALRDVLVDLTGNTHRSEICIDKLYNPDSSSGRRGLVELRGFEMPPHPDMALAQALLVRALVARFWENPYRAAPVRWGTALNDRWMLPWFVWNDLREVCDDLQAHDLPVQASWFLPHREFRFPMIGGFTDRGVQVELRMALEPWHVMGEEAGGGGTVRFVDSSVERLQVLVTGATPGRHRIAVNGRSIPLQPTGTPGELVAGVRYRAWQPPRCLHPTIGVHTPLVFDLVDGWNRRATAGCTYHVAHPGGRNYDTRPVNAFEAEARRRARFQPFGLVPGPRDPSPAPTDPDLPFTLDLRA
ncbi:MAG: hypothetical protein RLZZ127_903 [Planctomycetota bacterium]|jgi:uncharacterized protein (DUF2126 family)/transglutaminase-like putative cysteine protease